MPIDRSLVANLPLFRVWRRGTRRDPVEARSAATRRTRGVRTGRGRAFLLRAAARPCARQQDDAAEQVVVRYVVPASFGVAKAIGLTQYPATATTVDDSIVLAWPSAAWPGLVARYPALAANTLQTVGSRLQETHARVIEMSTQQVERRVAHALLRLAGQAGRKVEQGVEIDFPISRQDIAEMTGTTLHTVSRTLSAWEQQGLVEGGRQRIVVRDPHRLFKLAEDLG
jgi:CRP-like cAMP-binding protein